MDYLRCQRSKYGAARPLTGYIAYIPSHRWPFHVDTLPIREHDVKLFYEPSSLSASLHLPVTFPHVSAGMPHNGDYYFLASSASDPTRDVTKNPGPAALYRNNPTREGTQGRRETGRPVTIICSVTMFHQPNDDTFLPFPDRREHDIPHSIDVVPAWRCNSVAERARATFLPCPTSKVGRYLGSGAERVSRMDPRLQ